jgi:hypothetical protein
MQTKSNPAPTVPSPTPVSIIGGIFRLRRDLVWVIRESVISGTGVTLEQADLLLDVYGASRLGWDDPKAIAGGWVTFGALKKSLVHAAELLTRRIQDLYMANSQLPCPENLIGLGLPC